MLNVYFENVITRQRKRILPVALLKIQGTSLLDGQNALLAIYQGGLWRADDEHFFVVGVESLTAIHFENADIRSPSMGPYNPAWLVDGAIRAGRSQEVALARLDEHSGAWHVYADRTFWAAAVFTAVA
ncbi:MAG TPA: hypothetical protein VHC22_25805 [Pirellulales bacterium]|nr:hypothetical protein [Pirellulales bacterium]